MTILPASLPASEASAASITSIRRPANETPTVAQVARDYVEAGLALVPIQKGSKGPRLHGWNRLENVWTRPEQVPDGFDGNLGLAHAYSTPTTCVLDIDDYEKARPALFERAVDLDALLGAVDAVQIKSGREGRAKLVYRLGDDAEPFASINRQDLGFELRCASAEGLTVQDVLPPSIHPDTGRPYAWAGSGDWRDLPEVPDDLYRLLGALQVGPGAGAREESAYQRVIPETHYVAGPVAIDPQTVSELRSALAHIRSDDRDTWVAVGHDLFELGEAGRELWITWSQQSEKWQPGDARQWDTFKRSHSGYMKVFARAQALGWVNPKSTAARIGGSVLSVPATASCRGPRIEIVNAAELLQRQFEPVRWGVNGIFPEGVSLLAGAPKIGKSWFTLQAAVAVACGLPLWADRDPEEPGEVLMLALEDNDRRMQARLRTVLDGKSTIVPKGGTGWELVQPPGIERLNYVTQWDRIGQGGIERLDAHLTGRPQTRLVVIDTLARFRADDPGRKSAYAYDYDVGAQLKPLSDKHKVAVVLVHHTRKAASEDALDAVSGTQGLSGSVDAIMLLKRGRGAADGEMFVTGRDIEGDENTALRFDKESCAWSSLGSVEDVRRSAARRGVLDYLAEQGPLKPKDIAEGVGQKGPTVRKLLKAMLADGEVIVDDAGAYTVAKAA